MVVSGLAALSSFASATTLDFSDITTDQFGSPITSEGFVFDFHSALHGVVTDSYSTYNRVHNGTTTLIVSGNPTTEAGGTFHSASNEHFNLEIFDCAVFNGGTFPNFNLITVYGYHADGSWATASIEATTQWQTFTFDSSFNDIVSVEVHNLLDGPAAGSVGHQLDNIVVTSVPEPASMVAMALGVAALIRLRRRPRAS